MLGCIDLFFRVLSPVIPFTDRASGKQTAFPGVCRRIYAVACRAAHMKTVFDHGRDKHPILNRQRSAFQSAVRCGFTSSLRRASYLWRNGAPWVTNVKAQAFRLLSTSLDPAGGGFTVVFMQVKKRTEGSPSSLPRFLCACVYVFHSVPLLLSVWVCDQPGSELSPPLPRLRFE